MTAPTSKEMRDLILALGRADYTLQVGRSRVGTDVALLTLWLPNDTLHRFWDVERRLREEASHAPTRRADH